VKDAIECHRQAYLLHERAFKIDPSSVRARRGLSIDDYKISSLILEFDPNEALAGYHRALVNLSLLPNEI